MEIQFSQTDLECFAAASHDQNPLHMSSEYARRSAFGEAVVFGILGVLAAINAETRPEFAGQCITRILVLFRRPLFTETLYAVTVLQKGANRCNVTIEESGVAMMTATLHLRPRSGNAWEGVDLQSGRAAAAKMRGIAEPRNIQEMQPGLAVRGSYLPQPEAFAALVDRWRIDRGPLSPAQVSILLWASYLVGMELPGERALFSKLEMAFENDSLSPELGFDFDSRVMNFDDRFDLLDVDAEMSRKGSAIGRARISSFVRRNTPPIDLQMIQEVLPTSGFLSGKVAVVIGGSRGLGAAIAATLALQGCQVVATYRNSAKDILSLKELLAGQSASIEGMTLDAGDIGNCQQLRQEIEFRFGRLDILICNAAPHLKAFKFSPESLHRFQDFVEKSLAITAAPLSTFSELLRANCGSAVLISSAAAAPAADDYPRDWLHYVSSKGAAEGLFRAISLQIPQGRFLIARPPRLLTDQTNTPQGYHAAMRVERAAAIIVAKLLEKTDGKLELVEDFYGV